MCVALVLIETFVCEQKQALQSALDETQKELSAIRAERDEVVRKKAAIESREEDLKRTLNELTVEQNERGEKCSQHSMQMRVLESRNEALVAQVDEKTKTIAELQGLLTTVREEGQSLLQNTVRYQWIVDTEVIRRLLL